ncbi:MAG TPA: XTP/dITP diphosphatase [Dehalococcoidia bacterium]|jgi:XTP/dITP diphosphohydrolase|nr:XTP/dITP diphosphatase [Dehalococcoidia bacterium]HIK89895.1 XTP/dITP diphosphatase [Dehalococcoidia bacterium]
MTKKLLVATRNSGKVQEFSRMLSDMPFEVVGLDDLGIDIEVEETGSTFEENAVLKARAYAEVSGELTLADDSGLVVDALNGEPGVLSARYGGDGLDDEGRVQLVLDKMNHLPGWERTARFVAVLALAGDEVPNGLATSEGVIEGAIMHEPIGENGFGYDPVFWLATHAKTTAQLTGEEKDEISHRGSALRGLSETLKSLT